MKFRKPAWKKNKTWKRGYTKSKRFDKSCRNHGSCDYCSQGRQHKKTRAITAWYNDLKDWLFGENEKNQQ